MGVVEERLELDIGSALDAVSQLEAALSGLGGSFQAGFDESVAALQASLDAVGATPLSVPVDGDIDGLANALNEIEDRQVTVEVGADTSEAEDALDALDSKVADTAVTLEGAGGAADEAGGGFDHLSGSATILGTALQTGAKGGAGMAGQLQALAGRAGPAGVGLAAVAGGTAAIALSSVDADQALRQINRSLGEYAEIVEGVSVDGVADGLSELALAVGADDDAFRSAAASVGDFAKSAGVGQQAAAGTARDLVLLAVRTAALKPELGSASDIVDQLFAGLGRGGRALTAFGLAIPAAAIKALAADLAGGTENVTQFHLQVAGLQLAMAQVGGSLQHDIADNLDTPTVALRRLRTAFSEAFEEVGLELLPAVTEAITKLTPAVVELGGALADIAGPVGSALGAIVDGTIVVGGTLADARIAASDFVDVFAPGGRGPGDFVDSLANLATGGGAAAGSLDEVARAASGADGPLGDLATSAGRAAREEELLAKAADRVNDALGVGIDAAVARDRAFIAAGESRAKLAEAIKEEGNGSLQAGAAAREHAENLAELDRQTRILSGGTDDQASRLEQLIRRFAEYGQQLSGPARAANDRFIQDLKEMDARGKALEGDPRVMVVDAQVLPAASKLDALDRRLSPVRVISIDADTTAAFRRLEALDARLGSDRLSRRLGEAREHGGPFQANQLLLVGEQGPELVRFPQGGNVVTAQDTKAQLGGPTFRDLIVHEVAGDPRATLFLINSELGAGATR